MRVHLCACQSCSSTADLYGFTLSCDYKCMAAMHPLDQHLHWLAVCLLPYSVVVPCRGRLPRHPKADPPYLHTFKPCHRECDCQRSLQTFAIDICLAAASYLFIQRLVLSDLLCEDVLHRPCGHDHVSHPVPRQRRRRRPVLQPCTSVD